MLLLVAVVVLPWFFGGVDLDAYRMAAALVAIAAAWALVRRGYAGLGLGRVRGGILSRWQSRCRISRTDDIRPEPILMV